MTNQLIPTHPAQTQTVNINGFDIKFIHKPCRKDTAHLVVLLNGYRHGGWEYANSINFFKCSVLMIADVFKNGQSCYLGAQGTFEFSDAVASLIHKTLKSLMLTADDCTLIGPSKGGFAALYMGLKYNFKNIVAPAFVGHIGSWMVRYTPSIADHVMGVGYDGKVVEKYDRLLLDLIEQDDNPDKNIYVFLSKADNFYLELGQREVTQALAEKYRNFNALYADTELVFQHDQVTPYFLQETLSITSLLTQGITTRLNKHLTDDILQPSVIVPNERTKAVFAAKRSRYQDKPKAIGKLEKIHTEQGVMFVEGLLYLQGYDSPNYHYLSKHLKLKSVSSKSNQEYEFALGSVPKHPISREIFSDMYFDYTAAGTATMGLKGIDLKNIAQGRYEILVSATPSAEPEYRNYIAPKLNSELEQHDSDGYYNYRLNKQKDSLFLTKQPIICEQKDAQFHFSLKNTWAKDHLFHIEGEFLVKGADFSEFYVSKYYCVLRHCESGKQYAIALGQIKQENLGEAIGNFNGGYQACYYASMNLKGIDTTSFEHGKYEMFVSLAYQSEVFSHQIPQLLAINEQGCYFDKL
ncbi:Uncharacterised protein [Moraxella caviae]|uniref:Accessory Sec system protein Asp2 n=2 Tax=Moraxella caviae TaxID=34060 RepID=A0A378R321_9GAMM|nr:Uncharacterised protein [Moraxella caviae]VEW11804.1 Uncharacterised protein [Moraxella caviae]